MTNASLADLWCWFVREVWPLGVRGGTSDQKTVATATEEEPQEYKNWIELAIGGAITAAGDRAQFEQEHRLLGDQVYGGIQDLHVEGTVGKDALFSIDGHALWDFNDYDITVQLAKPNLGYIKAGYTEFRSWYDGNGGFFPHNDVFFDPAYPGSLIVGTFGLNWACVHRTGRRSRSATTMNFGLARKIQLYGATQI